MLPAAFPLVIYEEFAFQKTSKYCTDLAQMASYLEEESIYCELIQKKPSSMSDVVLASFCTNARSFLYPSTTLTRCYSGSNRELLMETTRNFPGLISPKLRFSTSTIITESDREAQRPPTFPGRIRPWQQGTTLAPKHRTTNGGVTETVTTCPHHKESVCTVCHLYMKHFGSQYGGHSHIPFSGHTRWYNQMTEGNWARTTEATAL